MLFGLIFKRETFGIIGKKKKEKLRMKLHNNFHLFQLGKKVLTRLFATTIKDLIITCNKRDIEMYRNILPSGISYAYILLNPIKLMYFFTFWA